MNIVKNILAVIESILVGGAVNMTIIMLSVSIIPPPAGVNVADYESIKAYMHLFQAKHFIMPFLAHAIGTLVGAQMVALMVTNHKMKFALGIGIWSLLGGIAACFVIPAPAWFMALDLILAYIPMAYLGAKLAGAGKAAASESISGGEVANG